MSNLTFLMITLVGAAINFVPACKGHYANSIVCAVNSLLALFFGMRLIFQLMECGI